MNGKDTYGPRLFRLLKWGIGILFCWYIYQVLQSEATVWPAEGLEAVLGSAKGMRLWIVLLLFPMNLLVEWVKWQMLLKQRVPFWWGIRTICTGTLAGLVSLNGLGDFAGRILYLPVDKRVQGSWAGIAGGLISFLVIMLAALPIFPYLLETKGLLPSGKITTLLKGLSWILVLLLALLYTRAGRLPLIFSNIKLLKGWKASFEALGNYTLGAMTAVLSLSMLRFLIGNVQLILLWQVFGLDLGFFEGFFWSVGLFGILALVPTVFITDIGVRGGVVLWLMSDFMGLSWQVLLPSYFLWLLNMIIPAVFGWFSMWFLKRNLDSSE